MWKELLENVRNTTPLVHSITNYVTVNDCANILLACGASPIMADAVEEAAEITSLCGALVINIGTLHSGSIPSMFAAGRQANVCEHPVILDPVGAGASKLRTETAKQLIEEISFTVIRGNSSEIKALAMGAADTKGVDADVADKVTAESLEQAVRFAKDFSKKTGAVIAITGELDIVANHESAFVIRNGRPEMGKITGTGCMLTAISAAFLAANKENPLEAMAGAVCAMGLCGERAFQRLAAQEGNATYRCKIIDELYHLDGETLEKGASYECW